MSLARAGNRASYSLGIDVDEMNLREQARERVEVDVVGVPSTEEGEPAVPTLGSAGRNLAGQPSPMTSEMFLMTCGAAVRGQLTRDSLRKAIAGDHFSTVARRTSPYEPIHAIAKPVNVVPPGWKPRPASCEIESRTTNEHRNAWRCG